MDGSMLSCIVVYIYIYYMCVRKLFSTDMGTNFAREGVSNAKSGKVESTKAIDGHLRSCTYTSYITGDDFHWWRVNFKKIILVREVVIANAKSRKRGTYSVHYLFCSQ